MPDTFASLFSGCGGADVGAIAAGLSHLWGIEVDARPAAIAQRNGFRTLVQDIRSTDWGSLESPSHLHASPPCQNASRANTKGGETDLDIELAQSVSAALRSHTPEVFTLENVEGYRHFQSFGLIADELLALGYSVAHAVLDAANYGAAQNRRRLFMVATRRAPAQLPHATHGPCAQQLSLFSGQLKQWVGWETAIAHLPEPPSRKLTPSQLSLIPSDFVGYALMTGWKNLNFKNALTIRRPMQPAPTLLAGMTQPSLRPYIIHRNWHGDVKAQVLDREHMAALQGFPSDYDWGSDRVAAFRGIGNAVSPLLMQQVLQANETVKGAIAC